MATFTTVTDNNEGLAGLMFRLTLGVMLAYTSAEAGLLASLRTEDQADRDIFRDWQVKRYARKLARQSAMAELESTARMRQIDIEATEKVYSLQKARETEQRVRDIKSEDHPDNATPVETKKPTVSTNSLDTVNRKRQLSKRHALDKMLRILSQNPKASPPEIAVLIGKSRQTVYDYLDELEVAGKLRRNGSISIIR